MRESEWDKHYNELWDSTDVDKAIAQDFKDREEKFILVCQALLGIGDIDVAIALAREELLKRGLV